MKRKEKIIFIVEVDLIIDEDEECIKEATKRYNISGKKYAKMNYKEFIKNIKQDIKDIKNRSVASFYANIKIPRIKIKEMKK